MTAPYALYERTTCNISKEHGRGFFWEIIRTKKSPSQFQEIHSIITGIRTFGLIRHILCPKAQVRSSYTPPLKLALNQSQGNIAGQVVKAFYKIEGWTFTFITMGDDDDEMPKSFEDIKVQEMTRYELKKAHPLKKNPPATQN